MTQVDDVARAAIRRPRVVIVGAGFGGLNAAHQLRNAEVDITIVDQNNFHTFQPLLYQVSTAYLSPEEVSDTVRSIFRRQHNLSVRVGRVVSVDWDLREIRLEGAATEDSGATTLSFDYLVLAAGATANFFGIEGMKEHSWPLYTLADAVRLRTHLLVELERAAAAPGTHPERSTVVVVGGGPTGVEMAGALASMGREFIGGNVSLRVILVEALPRLLNGFHEVSALRALHDLRARGVEILLDAKVASADDEGVELANGTRIATHTVVWGAGVRANPLGAALGLETGRAGTVKVGPDLQVPGKSGVFAVGDMATVDPPPDGTPLPALAPVAIQGGKHVGRQIAAMVKGQPTTAFRYRDKGIMAVIGRGDAVAELPLPGKRLRVGGLFAWLLWLGVHVVYLIGFRNRIKVLVDWGWNYLTSRGSGAVLLNVPERGSAD